MPVARRAQYCAFSAGLAHACLRGTTSALASRPLAGLRVALAGWAFGGRALGCLSVFMVLSVVNAHLRRKKVIFVKMFVDIF
jgi:hypothetical protein